ncbi:asparagine synthase (glutamine-hydrolyzing) [Rhodospirillaceae bacterium KN72]|uniref:asparagine synthase (glutamine-hydrolyzing) n=1 Tax=Pacificispira spongiicola TaxID=2729598 RepID=A0A7Y0HIM9_9PROT|nr:asparagine synthase (glutamine-hydrolyzing) [Pacificispira spongiicola]NMM46734.1 asparagine synthase (glutamine-hydrolyzing) [Pacificispira spongiicola]
MCGIAGYLSPSPIIDAGESDARLQAMVARLRHRGPDANGIWSAPSAGLAHTRLKVIDLTEAAAQPMSDQTGRFHLVFNGEIYNFKELRKELESEGRTFRSDGDTEVLLQAYMRWGDRTPERLVGMFAFAVYDFKEEKIFLARDRFGEKPLFYTLQNGAFLFSSEIKALLAWPGLRRRPNMQGLHRFLTYQYIPPPQTAFEDIYAMAPSCCLTIEKGATVLPEPTRYWRLPNHSITTARTTEEAAEGLLDHLARAVKRQSVSDVSLGVLLSGGLDSGTITYLLHKIFPEQLSAFTIGFPSKELDESIFAKAICKDLSVEHYIGSVQGAVQDTVAHLAKIFDEPLADPATIPSLSLMGLVRGNVTVAMSGDGCDEVLLGYARYVGCKLASALDFLPLNVRQMAIRSAYWLEKNGMSKARAARYAIRLAKELGTADEFRYANMISFFNDSDRDGLYSGDMRSFMDIKIAEEISEKMSGDGDIMTRASQFDLENYVPGALMTKTDRTAMAHSLEVRCPFLDHELVEFCCGIPERIRLPGTSPKAVLVNAMDGRLPDSILTRDKVGLTPPLAEWLRNELWDLTNDQLSEDRVRSRGIFKPEAVQSMLSELRRGENRHQYKIWSLLQLEQWYSTWIDEPVASG